MRKSAIFAVVMTLIGLGLLIATFLVQEDWIIPQFMGILWMVWAGIWALSAFTGIVVLLRKGFLSKTMEAWGGMAAWLGCVVLLMFGWILLPLIALFGPYLLWFAATRRGLPQCPNCKRFVPVGVRVCPQCGTVMPGPTGMAAAPAQPVSPKVQAAPEGPEVQLAPESQAVQQVPAPPTPVQRIEAINVTTCENCHKETTAGNLYTFFYGVLTGTDMPDSKHIREDFKVSGSETVYLCDNCIKQNLNKRGRIFAFILGIGGVVLIGVGLLLRALGVSQASGGLDPQGFICGGFIFLVMMPVILQTIRGQAKKGALEGPGDAMAIGLRKAVLQQRGFTRFWTRQQLRDLGVKPD
jgi:hypothetical protein